MTMAEKKTRTAARPAAKKPKKAKSKAARPKPAKASPAKAAPAKASTAAKTGRAAKPKPAQRRARSADSSGFDVARMLDHPLVADLLAVGAIAAVAAIADHSVRTRTGEAEAGSSKAVKAACKAAAAAIGKRLLTEVEAIRQVSKTKKAKSAAK